MSVIQTPAPARSDVDLDAGARPGPAATRPTGRAAKPFLVHGTVLTAGALSWAAVTAVFGIDVTGTVPLVAMMLGSGLFQVGVLMLLRVLRRTQAIGGGRLARTFLAIETGLITLALGSTIADGLQLSNLTQPGWALLDATWPLSMLGMFAIGIRIAIAGRWKGASRFWPMVAESWAVVVVPSLMILGPDVARVVAALHLVVGYAVLGQIVARKSDGSGA